MVVRDCSTRIQGTERRERAKAVRKPTGPPPTMMMGLSYPASFNIEPIVLLYPAVVVQRTGLYENTTEKEL